MTKGDAGRRAEKLESHPEGSRRNGREEGLGASRVTARRETLLRRRRFVAAAVVESSCCCLNCAIFSGLHEPPYTEPYVRWCGRTAEVTPPTTRSGVLEDWKIKRKGELYDRRKRKH